ncbi:MAG TPA: ABC transporter substrate-binding protein [Victivallales bacterium]|nr:ABC transporter substrate-binding protein [Victivallales bacterium]
MFKKSLAYLLCGAAMFFSVALIANTTTAQTAKTPSKNLITKGTVTFAYSASDLDGATVAVLAKKYMKEHPGITIKLFKLPQSADQRLGFYLQLFQAKSSKVDIMQMDNLTLSAVPDNLVNLNDYGVQSLTKQIFQGMVKTDNINGKQIGIPWYGDVGVMYYRKDLLKKYGFKPPKTWPELMKAAAVIQAGQRKAGDPDFVGFVWQGNAYEGLTCDALEWIHSMGGGTIVSPDKKVTLNNPKAIKAIEMAASWIGTISPKGVLSYTEEQSMEVFDGGHAAFLRSWPYIYQMANMKGSPVKGKVGVVAIPSSIGLHQGNAGFESLCINKYSKNKKLAVQVAEYFAGYQSQMYRGIKGGVCPTLKNVYKDKQFIKQAPQLSVFDKFLSNTFNIPANQTSPNYNKVSKTFYTAVHNVLLGNVSAKIALANAAKTIEGITGYPAGQPMIQK